MGRLCLLLLLLACTTVRYANAGMNEFESCRCNNGIAYKGDKKGKPVRQQYSASRDCREMWIYNFGPNEFMQGICFDNSQVKKVVSLGHGY